MDSTVERIVTAVDRRVPEMIAFLQEIVRVPSVTGDEGAVQSVIADRMVDLGLDVDRWEPTVAELAPYAFHVGEFATLSGRPNVVGTARGAGGGRSLILNAHIDVVDAGAPERWTHPPYAAEIHDGKIYGRGSCDMKAGLAANLYALIAVRDAGIALRGDVHVESVIGEEDGGAGTLATILRGYRADAAIITEPTRLAVVAAQGGSLVFRLHVPGRSAHGCVRDEGVSAVEKFAYLHRALLDFEAERNGKIEHPLYAGFANKIPISIGVVRAGSWPSSVPESLIAEGRAGLVPGETLDGFCTEFVHVIDRAADADPWLREHRPTVEWFSGQFAPAEVPTDSPVIDLIRGSHREVTGVEPSVEAVTYGADMRHFVNHAGMPCAMYGAGDVRVAHFTDEFVPIDEVITVARAIAVAIARFCA
ncbi:MAG: ArgE/DapE family deacylase [Thermomicrobiales bacterium]|nr:ArgE/DapE family deacylase [Thermomicrobiales bacterium]